MCLCCCKKYRCVEVFSGMASKGVGIHPTWGLRRLFVPGKAALQIVRLAGRGSPDSCLSQSLAHSDLPIITTGVANHGAGSSTLDMLLFSDVF